MRLGESRSVPKKLSGHRFDRSKRATGLLQPVASLHTILSGSGPTQITVESFPVLQAIRRGALQVQTNLLKMELVGLGQMAPCVFDAKNTTDENRVIPQSGFEL